MALIIPYNNTRIFNFKITPKLLVPKNLIKPPHVLNKNYTPSNKSAIVTNNMDKLSKIKYASKIAANSLSKAINLIQNKTLRTGDEVDKFIHKYIITHHCYPSSLGYQSFPKTLCISPNDGKYIYK
jgi:methionyl aminopeptidase